MAPLLRGGGGGGGFGNMWVRSGVRDRRSYTILYPVHNTGTMSKQLNMQISKHLNRYFGHQVNLQR